MFKMQGVIPPMITPFKENGDLDVLGLQALVTFLRERVDGLFINGSYGSGALMTTEERKKTAEIIMDAVDGQAAVVVQTGSTNNRTSVELTKHAASIGAQAVSAVGPYYFKHNDDSICYFFDDMLKAAGPNMPVYVYNNPQFQGYPMSEQLLARLKAMGIRGIKDATFDIMLHATYQRTLADDTFDVVLGTESMWLAARVLGCQAFIPGLGNAFPEIIGQMYREGMAGDYNACKTTQFKVNRLREIMYVAKSTQLAIYAMLEIRGILKCYPRAPFIPASAEEKQKIRQQLDELDVLK